MVFEKAGISMLIKTGLKGGKTKTPGFTQAFTIEYFSKLFPQSL